MFSEHLQKAPVCSRMMPWITENTQPPIEIFGAQGYLTRERVIPPETNDQRFMQNRLHDNPIFG
jgi:hypothetical protein